MVLVCHTSTYKKHCCGFSPAGSNYELEALRQCIPLPRHVLPVSWYGSGLPPKFIQCWACHSPSKLPIPKGGIWTPSNMWFLGCTWLNIPNGISISLTIYAQLRADNGHLPPQKKIAPSHGGSGPPSNTFFLGHTWVHNPNRISISSAVFVGFIVQRPYTLQWAAPLP